MGILNITPDSFSDGRTIDSPEDVLKDVKRMIDEGADIIDVGGESTRPGAIPVSEEDEINRVLPVVKMIKENFDIPISVDTYKSGVARAVLEAGADMINDIKGLKNLNIYDKSADEFKNVYNGTPENEAESKRITDMAKVIEKYNVPVCIMHNRELMAYDNLIEDIKEDLRESVSIAKAAGIKDENIILDPGVGFAKTYEDNLKVIKEIDSICELDYPVLLGVSRKSVIGMTLDLPVNEREEGTIAISVMAAEKGVKFVRVHNVKGNVRALKMYEAIKGIGE